MEKLNRIAVVPDVHGSDFWKEAKENIDSLDKVIFLGDYLDAYLDIYMIASILQFPSLNEKELEARKVELNNFKEILEFKKAYPEKVTLLLGNHDIGYWLDKSCSRQASGKMYKTYKSLFEDNINLFKFTEYVELDNEKILFSHAGILGKWLKQIKPELGIDSFSLKKSFLDGSFNKLILKYNEPGYREFLRQAFWLVGPARGGNINDSGSIVWADKSEWKDQKNIFGDIKQIVGHSKSYSPVDLTEGVRCIDTVDSKVLYLGE